MSHVNPLAYLAGGGEMGERVRTFDWSNNPLGPISDWPQSLMTAVRILLNSRYPMFIWWGRELINIYNDAYIPVHGAQHPQALGQSAPHIWESIWPVVGPQAKLVLNEGRATWNESVLLMLERYGHPEETYFTFSYSPVPDDAGSVGGVFCACTEDTQRVVGERQLALLRDLAAKTADARTWQEACERSADALSSNLHDLPFAMIYIAESGHSGLSLAGASGIERGHPAAPEGVGRGEQAPWPLAPVLGARDVVVIEDLSTVVETSLPTGAWQEPPRQAALVPIAATGQTGRGGVLVVGVSPFRRFDDDYRNFLMLVGGQISASIVSAQAYEEEKKRAEALAELDRAKTAFFSNVSHEFRTPLTLMLGPVEEMLEPNRSDLTPAAKGQLEIVHRNSLRLLKLVNTMLDFSRIEAGRIQARYEPVALAGYTAELASVFRAAIERAGLRLIVNCPPLPEPVYVDRDMWEKIVLNLLSNAFKFTMDGEIEVRLEPIDRHVRLTVRDTGVGIPAEEMPRVFERFHRVKDLRGRTHEGTGIGLALVQELVRLHGGAVHVESVLNEGSRFIVTVPLGKTHLDPQRIGATSDLMTTNTGQEAFVQEALRWLPDADRDDDQLHTRDAREADNSSVVHFSFDEQLEGVRPRIIVADDNADMLDYVSRLLGEQFAVEAVADGQAALEAAQASPPDLMLCDVMMPMLDGLGLLRALRADPELREIPIILLSARAGEEARIEGMEVGADDYLVKPFSARELLARVESHIALARLRREANQALRRSEQRLSAILEQVPVSIGVTDADGRVILSNHLWRKYVPGRIPSHNTEHTHRWQAFADDGKPVPRENWPGAQALRGQPVAGMDFLHTLDEGREIWLRVSAAPFRDKNGDIIGAIFVIEDIDAQRQSEQALRESEARFRALSEAVPAMVWACRPDGNVTYINQHWIDYTGQTHEEYQGYGWTETLHPEDRPRVLAHWERCTRTGEIYEGEVRYRRYDGEYRWHYFRGVPMRNDASAISIWYGASIDIQDKKVAEEALEDRVEARTRQVRDLARRLTMAEQEERRRIAQILHDDLQQLLYAIEMRMEMIRPDLQRSELDNLTASLENVRAWVGQAITTTRQLTVDLSPPILHNEGLVDAVGWLQRQMQELHELEVVTEAEHSFYLPDDDLRVLLFQFVRELLFNVKKHAGVNQATVKLMEEGEYLVIHVIDKGQGFDVQEATARREQTGGIGLFRIQERLGLLGGRLEIRSQPGQGTHVVMYAPMGLEAPE